jgi:hypothetical protein
MGPVLRFRTIRGEGVIMHSEGANRSRRGLGWELGSAPFRPNSSSYIVAHTEGYTCDAIGCGGVSRSRATLCRRTGQTSIDGFALNSSL